MGPPWPWGDQEGYEKNDQGLFQLPDLDLEAAGVLEAFQSGKPVVTLFVVDDRAAGHDHPYGVIYLRQVRCSAEHGRDMGGRCCSRLELCGFWYMGVYPMHTAVHMPLFLTVIHVHAACRPHALRACRCCPCGMHWQRQQRPRRQLMGQGQGGLLAAAASV